MLLSAALFLGACAPSVGPVSGSASQEPVSTITVVGRGQASARPEIARTNLGVEVRAATVTEAMRQANERMNAVIAALKQLGIADRDLRTSNFSIDYEPPVEPERRPAGAPEPPRVGLYRVSNVVEVTIRDLDKVSAVLQAAVDAGANTTWNIAFAIENTKPLEAQSLEKAVDDARSNAETLARRSGVTLGHIHSIQELSTGDPRFESFAKLASDAAGPPIEAGELTISKQVQLVYTISTPSK